jgi:hypothetical protein
VTDARKQVRLSDPELPGLYEVVERRSDRSLLLRLEPEHLSDVLREFIAHLERVAAAEDDLPDA